ncbi:hypothetical protein GCM10023116_29630 [Kistimonas scapharcae]|uniref:PepSY domain-containing protein n=1 Tax=Kistimonas scapharcae TaxID=1036133 RepID=A0ABP8V602_9GAMM
MDKHISNITTEELNTAVKESAEHGIASSWSAGLPVSYMDRDGILIQEFSDGRKIKLARIDYTSITKSSSK